MTSPAPAAPPARPAADPAGRGVERGARAGLLVAVVLVVASFVVPPLLGWDVHTRAPRSLGGDDPVTVVPPLHGYWEPRVPGVAIVVALLLGLAAWRWGADLVARLPWRRLLLLAYVVSLAWMLALALAEGTTGLSHPLSHPAEYLPAAREIDDVHQMLREYVSRISYDAAPRNWPTHLAGHPPGAVLFFIALIRVGLGSDLQVGVVVTVLAAATAPAVLVTLRALGAETLARRAAPLLVVAPSAVFMAVSGDALFTVVAAWGLACLALGATAPGRGRWAWALPAGLLLGYGVMMSYGLVLIGLVAVAVLVAGSTPLRARLLTFAVSAATALAVVLVFAALGFAWWEAYPVLEERYWDGIAKDRPGAYWTWGNLGALLVSAGLLLGPALGATAALARRVWHERRGTPTGDGRAVRTVVLLSGAGALAVALADASQMSRSEVERIWLPFIPWMMVATALLPERWRRAGLLAQVVVAVLVEQLLWTTW